MKLCAFLRVSTDRQVKEGYGLPAQRSEIRSWARANGHRIVTWCADEGVSGANGIADRRGLYEALSALKDGKADGIVFTSLDRLARKMTEQEGVLAQVWATGARAFSIGDGGEVLEDDPDDPIRTAGRQMRGVFSQLDRGLIRSRMSKGKREKALRGGYVGGRPAFGRRAVGRELIADDGEQAVVRLVVSLRSKDRPSGRLSIREVIKVLEQEGHTPKGGGRWHPTQVSRIAARAGLAPG